MALGPRSYWALHAVWLTCMTARYVFPNLKPIAVFGRCCTRADLLRYPCPACQVKGTMQSPCDLIKSGEYVYVMLPGVVIHTHVVLISEFDWTYIEHADAINF